VLQARAGAEPVQRFILVQFGSDNREKPANFKNCVITLCEMSEVGKGEARCICSRVLIVCTCE
jgi:hypothetical protein